MRAGIWALAGSGLAVLACLLASQARLLALFDRETEAQAMRAAASTVPTHAARDIPASSRLQAEKNETGRAPAGPGDAVKETGAWNFPRGLASFADEALAARDPSGAYTAALALRACEFMAMDMEAAQRALSSTPELKTRQAHLDKYQAMQARAGQCQTLTGDVAEKQLALLTLAVAGGVPGAAAAQLALDPRLTPVIAARLSADAQRGDIESITQLIWRSPAELGISPDLHQAITQALQKARHDERVAVLASSYMDVASSWASVRQSKNPKSGSALLASLTNPVSPGTEAKAQEIFQAIKARYAR